VHLKYTLWVNRIGTKKSIITSLFQMVYRTNVVLPINLVLPVMKLWQDKKEELNHVTRRMNQLIKVQQHKVDVDERLQKYHDDMKMIFDRKTKDREFLPGDLFLKWDVRKEYSMKHGKFDHIWYGPFKVASPERINPFLLENLDSKIFNAPVNGRYLKHYMK
jgi:hypothetical protein